MTWIECKQEFWDLLVSGVSLCYVLALARLHTPYPRLALANNMGSKGQFIGM